MDHHWARRHSSRCQLADDGSVATLEKPPRAGRASKTSALASAHLPAYSRSHAGGQARNCPALRTESRAQSDEPHRDGLRRR